MSKITTYMDSNMTGVRIAQVRTAHGLTQKEFGIQLADYLHRSRPFSITSISAYELGRKMPSIEVLYAICGLYGVSVDYLIGKENTSNSVRSTEEAEVERTVTNDANSTRILKRKISHSKLSSSMYREYNRKPVFVVFPQKEHADQWGLLDSINEKVVFMEFEASFSAVAMDLYPLESYDYHTFHQIRRSRPLSTADFYQLTGQFWVEIKSPDDDMKNLYNGFYIFGKSRKSIVNVSNGEVLPVSGYGKSFSVYSEPSDEYID